MDDITTLQKLHESREREKLLRANLDIVNEFLRQSLPYKNAQELIAQISAEHNNQEKLIGCINAYALGAHHRDKTNKQPLPGVNIGVGKVVRYDRVIARDWCLHNLHAALELDERAFEKCMRLISRNNATTSPLPEFVKVEDEAFVVIADDLSKYLATSMET
jgi:hypothetical protein